ADRDLLSFPTRRSSDLKRAPMGQAAAAGADVVIVTDDNPRSEDPAAIRAQVLEGAPEAIEIGGRREAIRAAIDMAGSEDIVLVADRKSTRLNSSHVEIS